MGLLWNKWWGNINPLRKLIVFSYPRSQSLTHRFSQISNIPALPAFVNLASSFSNFRKKLKSSVTEANEFLHSGLWQKIKSSKQDNRRGSKWRREYPNPCSKRYRISIKLNLITCKWQLPYLESWLHYQRPGMTDGKN